MKHAKDQNNRLSEAISLPIAGQTFWNLDVKILKFLDLYMYSIFRPRFLLTVIKKQVKSAGIPDSNYRYFLAWFLSKNNSKAYLHF